ncbi:tape measure protein [Endozoicomonas atrinae]|uniref:tape measure protein n=1 Tax=Endozoicomonas atrinae TaxID=1333660 RepID=UPI003B00AC09
MASLKKSAIQLVLKAKDALSGKVKKSAESLDVLKGEAADLQKQLKKLKEQKALLTSFEKQTKATKEASKAFSAAKAKVERLAKELNQAEKPTKGMKSALTKARQEVKKANTAYGRQREVLAKLREQLTKTGLSSSKLAQQQERLAEEIEDTGNAFWKANKKAKEADRTLKKDTLKKVARDADQASTSVGSLARRLGGLVAAGADLYAIKRGIQAILSTGDKFERLNVQLEAMMGSAAEGERALAWIKNFTKTTPYQLDEVSDAFVRLKAFGFDPMDGTMQAVVDQAVMLGGGFDRLRGIAVGLGQAWAKQRLQGEEILQLFERGVPVWEMLERVTGKNVLKIRKLSETGKLGRDVIRGLINEIAKGADGAAAKNMTLLTGYVSNLKDEWSYFLDAIGSSGAMDYAKAQMKALADRIKEMNQDGSLQELSKNISRSMIAAGEAIKKAVGDITLDDVVTKSSEAFSALTKGLDTIAKAFTVTTNSVTAFFEGFQVGVKGFASGFLYTVGEIIYGYGKIAETVKASDIAKPMLETTNYLRALGKEFADSAAGNAKAAKQAVDNVIDTITKKSEDSTTKFQASIKRNIDLSKKKIDELLGNYQKVNEAIEEVGETFGDTFESAAVALEKIDAAETSAELASLGVVLAESLRAGIITQEEYYEATEASREKLQQFNKEARKTKESLKDVGDSAEQAGAQQAEALTDASTIAGVMAGHYITLAEELQGMSGAAHDAFVAMNGVGNINTEQAISSIAELKSQLEETREELNKLQHSYTFDVTGISSWMNETAKNAAYVKSQYLEQKIALEELLESYEQGDYIARRFLRQGERAADTMNLLNNQDLDRLNNAIRSAAQNMASLGESSRNTLNSLQDELDELQGRQSDIEQRRYQSQRDDLKAQQAEAIAKGDQEAIKNITSALRISEQIYNERLRQANNEKAKALQENQVSTSAPTTRTTQPAPQKIIRLEYPGGAVNVGIDSTDETKLLEALKNAGMRTV